MKGNLEVILVDIGNTLVKSVEVLDGIIGVIKTHADIEGLIKAHPPKTEFMICTTRSEKFGDEQTTFLSHTTPLPIKLEYDTPETLGMDRVAAAVGVHTLFPHTNNLIIDMGTCITMDLISQDGVFNGGVISPGLKMRMKAMADNTANLPNIIDKWENIEYRSLGKSTQECLKAGSYGGIISEIEGTLSKLRRDFTSINVILTGGDAHYFESKLKAHIFAGSKIVLTGLYRIWKDIKLGESEYTVKEK